MHILFGLVRNGRHAGGRLPINNVESKLEVVLEFELHDALIVAAEPLLEMLRTEEVCGFAVCIPVGVACDDWATRVARPRGWAGIRRAYRSDRAGIVYGDGVGCVVIEVVLRLGFARAEGGKRVIEPVEGRGRELNRVVLVNGERLGECKIVFHVGLPSDEGQAESTGGTEWRRREARSIELILHQASLRIASQLRTASDNACVRTEEGICTYTSGIYGKRLRITWGRQRVRVVLDIDAWPTGV